MNKICIGFCDEKKPNAGPKAQNDAITIAKQMNGYTYIPFTCKNENIKVGSIRPFLEFHVLKLFIKKLSSFSNAIIFLNHPISLLVMLYGSYKYLAKRNKVILLSHDINQLRGQKQSKQKLNQLYKASCIITHNDLYSKYLRQIGINVPLIPIGIFDYLIDNIQDLPKKGFSKTVSFIGNLKKGQFIADWICSSEGYSIELIGECSQKQKEDFDFHKCNYKGTFSPDEVPFKISSSFGLVWDGDSINTCSGPYGEYLRYNNPHKASLYLACGMPVFIWSQAALAGFIKENKVGFLIDKLDDIEKILDTLTQTDYDELQKNIKPIQEKITHGWYLKQALAKAEQVVLTEW